jgi:hypothetical protein
MKKNIVHKKFLKFKNIFPQKTTTENLEADAIAGGSKCMKTIMLYMHAWYC